MATTAPLSRAIGEPPLDSDQAGDRADIDDAIPSMRAAAAGRTSYQKHAFDVDAKHAAGNPPVRSPRYCPPDRCRRCSQECRARPPKRRPCWTAAFVGNIEDQDGRLGHLARERFCGRLVDIDDGTAAPAAASARQVAAPIPLAPPVTSALRPSRSKRSSSSSEF